MFTYNNKRIVIHRINKKVKTNVTVSDIRKTDVYNEKLIALPQNDTGNAERFLLFCRDFVKYNSTIQEWMLWDGKLWRTDNAYADIIVLAQAVMEKYYSIAKTTTNIDDKVKKAIVYHAKSSNNYQGLGNMLSLVKHMNYVKEMKSKPYLLNVQNGVVNLKTKELLRHHPSYGCTNICLCDYKPDVKSGRFKSFVKEITNNNPELYSYLKTLAGYFSTGLCKEEKFWVMHGPGGNGKSKYLEALGRVLGGYACVFPTNALTKTNTDSGRPTPKLVPVINKRFANASELDAKHVINDASIKQYTGNSHILVRKMRQEYAKVEVTFKIVIDSNFEPNFKCFDDAIKRRIVIVPFTRKFEGTQRDGELVPKLIKDNEYILKYIIEGAYDYYKHGLHEPEIVKAAAAKYCLEADSVQSFIENVTATEIGCYIKSSHLHQAYVEFCMANMFEPLDNKSFSQTLIRKGIDKKLKNSGTYFRNIKLIN